MAFNYISPSSCDVPESYCFTFLACPLFPGPAPYPSVSIEFQRLSPVIELNNSVALLLYLTSSCDVPTSYCFTFLACPVFPGPAPQPCGDGELQRPCPVNECTLDSECSDGLKCCYPCGVEGCGLKCIQPTIQSLVPFGTTV